MRVLSETVRSQLFRVADELLPPSSQMPSLRSADADGQWCNRVCLARPDLLDDLESVLDSFDGGDVADQLRTLHTVDRVAFDVIATFVAGAYYLVPEVRALLGYPGQVRNPAPLQLAVDELSDEIFEGAVNFTGSFREV